VVTTHHLGVVMALAGVGLPWKGRPSSTRWLPEMEAVGGFRLGEQEE
jgi:hypothetical protein